MPAVVTRRRGSLLFTRKIAGAADGGLQVGADGANPKTLPASLPGTPIITNALEWHVSSCLTDLPAALVKVLEGGQRPLVLVELCSHGMDCLPPSSAPLTAFLELRACP